ncbi:plasminogen-like isoform X2 [Branchiostoma floridae x Branchiostoma japonicum]
MSNCRKLVGSVWCDFSLGAHRQVSTEPALRWHSLPQTVVNVYRLLKQDFFPWLTVPRGDPDMSNMAMVLLLLLAAATCTAAADMPAGVDISDVEERSEDPGQNNDYFRRGLDPKAQGAEACLVYKGELYRGKLATTVTGKRCQRWASQTPHSHKYRPEKYRLAGLDENYCRNPNGHSAPWCYTMDQGKRWEICNVPGCDCVHSKGTTYRGTIAVTWYGETCQPWASQTPHSHKYTPAKYPNYGLDQNYCRNPSGSTGPWCYTMDPGKKWEYCYIPGCECVEGTGATYRGTVAVTKSGTHCQSWDSTIPHKPRYTPPDGKDHNYCRNPSGAAMPWCYTLDSGKKWEYCDIQPCECRMGKGTSYRGTVSVTWSGDTCQRWDSKSPHKPDYTPPDRKDHNYCRNPSSSELPWCYTTNPKRRWEYCSIPGCGDSMGAQAMRSSLLQEEAAEEDPDVDEDQADEIPREFSVVWQPEEDPDVDDDLADEIPREMGETWEEQEDDDVSEDEEDGDAILEELDGLVEELREIVGQKQMEMEEWADEKK